MRKGTTFILLFLVAGLGFLITRLEKDVPTTKAQLEAESRVWSFEPDQVEHVSITRSIQPRLVLSKDTSGWSLAEPLQTSADDSMVESFLTNLNQLRTSRRLALTGDASVSLSSLGLSNPTHSVTIRTQDTEVSLDMGVRTPIGTDRFAHVRGEDEVLVVGPELADWLGWELARWRDRRALHFEPYDVSAVSLELADQAIELERPSINWLITNPVRFPANHDFIQNMLKQFSSLEIRSFLTDTQPQLDAFGLDAPVGVVRITLRSDGSQKVLVWGNALEAQEGQVACMQEGKESVWGVNGTVFEDIAQGLNILRQSRALTFHPYELKALGLEHKGQEVSLVKEDTQSWERLEELVRKIGNFRSIEYIDEPQGLEMFGLDAPSARIVATLEAPERKEALLFGELRPGDEVYVKQEAFASVFVIDAAAMDLVKQEVKFWSKQ